MKGVELIAAERERHFDEEGWTPEHDAQHKNGELALAAACYAAPVNIYRHVSFLDNDGRGEVHSFRDPFPRSWSPEWDKRSKHDRITQLKIAGALCAAEIDRIQAEEGGNCPLIGVKCKRHEEQVGALSCFGCEETPIESDPLDP